MPRLTVGEKMPNFTYDTAYATDLSLAETISGKKTAVIFLRYYGCPLCQLDIHEYAVAYPRLQEAGIQLLVVLQSKPELMKAALGSEDALPFSIICDPEMKMYQALEIPAGSGIEEMIGPNTMAKIALVDAAGYQHGENEGIEEQLPASFVMDETGTLVAVKYAQYLDEILDTDQILACF